LDKTMTPLTTRRSFLKRAMLAGATFALGVRCAPAEVAPSASLPYTAQEIAARLGVSMAVYQKERLGARHVAAIRAAGITRIELLMMPQTFDLHDCDQSSVIFVRE
jgi:hypothetical protein